MRKLNSIVIIGGGGHCFSVISSINSAKKFKIAGIVDKRIYKGKLMSCDVLGNDDELGNVFIKGIQHAHIAMGTINSRTTKERIYLKIKEIGFVLPIIIDKSAVVCKSACVGEGAFIGKNAVVNAMATIGKFCIVNSCSIVEHGCVIGDYTHLAPASVVCGDVKIGENCYIGANATIIQGVTIADNVKVGAGAVVINDIAKVGCTVVGIPAKEVVK